jgi:hypothetical protein
MAFDRSLIAVVILAVSMAAVASDTGPGRTRDAASAQSSQSDEASRQVVITDRLAALLTPAGVAVVAGLEARKTAAFRQVQVHWEAPGGAASAANAQPASGALTAGQSAPAVGDLPRRRSLELAETEVLIIAVDAQSRLLWWHVMTPGCCVPRVWVRPENSRAASLMYHGWTSRSPIPMTPR